jgi:PP-loop superfamily ATP-utilizing enzyme
MEVKNINKDNPVIAWWSGGVTSAVTCYLCIKWFGVENVRVIFIDTKNEDSSTYVFKEQCENWYGCKIETITNTNYETIQDVWYRFNSLNVSHGAICSSTLKRDVRRKFETHNNYSYQAFGFDAEELKRAKGMASNNPKARPIFPLLGLMLTKLNCIDIIKSAKSIFLEIDIPASYKLGYNNNNCLKTGCVQGGIGYWQKMDRDYPDKVDAMGKIEHDLTDRKGVPVTMLKNSKGPVFLRKHTKYPDAQILANMEGREPKPLFECNGFCGTNDLVKNETEKEINYQD